MSGNKHVFYTDWGLVPYQKAWDLQVEIFDRLAGQKLENRLNENQENGSQKIPPIVTNNYLFFCEHPHVYTLGKSGKEDNLLISSQELLNKNAEFYHINRGGDITYHGPGQIVGYPILDLDNFFTDIHKYMRYMEEVVIRTLAEYNLSAGRVEGLTGVWLGTKEGEFPRKICAMGVKVSRWITMHGFALNVNTDLSYFGNIVPCGIADKGVTSLAQELGGEPQDMAQVKKLLLKHFEEVFEMKITEKI
jgi:lipoyl(octanoyl) transferase